MEKIDSRRGPSFLSVTNSYDQEMKKDDVIKEMQHAWGTLKLRTKIHPEN